MTHSYLSRALAEEEESMMNEPLAKRIKQINILFQIGLPLPPHLWNEGVWVQMTPHSQNETSFLQGGSFSNGFLNVLSCFCQGACIVPLQQKRWFSSYDPLLGWPIAPGSSLGPEWSLCACFPCSTAPSCSKTELFWWELVNRLCLDRLGLFSPIKRGY